MHGSISDRRALEREALRNVIAQWNANRLDLFELSEPNEDLEFHGVMRFYFQDSGQKVATKCIRVASDATVADVIGTLIEKFRPDMRMLSVPSYALYELHENCQERKMAPDEKPLLVQLNWHVDDREGRFLLKNIDDKSNVSNVGINETSFRRKLSKREKKQLKKQEKLSRLKGEEESKEKPDGVAEQLYTELPETSFTRSISNPEAVMRRRRQQILERKLQQYRSKDGGPDTGGTLKIYGESLCQDVPYKTLLLSVRDCASSVVREMLDKYGLLGRADPSQWCLVQVTTPANNNNNGAAPGVSSADHEYVLDDDECPLAILMNHSNNKGSIMFHVRRRPADCAPRKRKKKAAIGGSGSSGSGSGSNANTAGGGVGAAGNLRDSRSSDYLAAAVLVELGPDGAPLQQHSGDPGRTLRLTGEVMEVGSANGIALQLYGPHIQPRHCVIASAEGLISLTPCHTDAYTYVNGQRIYQTTILQHGNLVKFGNSNTYRFLDPSQELKARYSSNMDSSMYDSRSPRALSPTDAMPRENYETTFDLDGNVETVSTASVKEDSRSLGSVSENRLNNSERYPRGQDPILPAVLEFPEEPQEQFLARVITHLNIGVLSFQLAPAYTLYLCARYRASTHYRPELTPTERAQKLTLLLHHAAAMVRHTVQERQADPQAQAFWLANASELLHFLKSDRHVGAFSTQAQDVLADAVQLAFRQLCACLTDELNGLLGGLLVGVDGQEDQQQSQVIAYLSASMSTLRKCRVNAALTIQLFSQLFHWVSARCLSAVISNPAFCCRAFGARLVARLRGLQAWAESQGLELAAECHLAKIQQCAHLLQAPKATPDELAALAGACFKLNSLQLRALLGQYRPEAGEVLAAQALVEQTVRAAEGVADELIRAEGREVRLHEDAQLPVQLLLPDDGFSCDVVQGVPQGLAEFLQPLQAAGLCRLAGQPTSSGLWTVYMNSPRPPSSLSATQPEVQTIRLHKAGGGMGLSIVAAKGAGQERLGIYIKSVVPGGAADLDGRLAAGDQLLSVDGQSLLGITQERAAEFLVRTSSVVSLEVAKGGAVYHGLASLLQQPSPTQQRGPRRLSERDLPSRIDSEQQPQQQRPIMPASKSVPSLHHVATGGGNTPAAVASSNAMIYHPNNRGHLHHHHHEAFNPGYSRTSSSNSLNNAMVNSNSNNGQASLRSKSAHNLTQQQMQQQQIQQQQQQQQDGFYQNLSVYSRNKMPSPQQLGERTSALRSSQSSLHSTNQQQQQLQQQQPPLQRPSSVYYPPAANAAMNSTPSGRNLHQSIPNLKTAAAMMPSSYPQYAHQLQQQREYDNNLLMQQQQHQQHHQQQQMVVNGANYYGMVPSKSEDTLKQMQQQQELVRFASSGHLDKGLLLREAKMLEMGEEVKRRQNRMQQQQQQQQQHQNNISQQQYYYYQQQQQQLQQQQLQQQRYADVSQPMMNLSINTANSYSPGGLVSPKNHQYLMAKSPPVAPKPAANKRMNEDVPPELPPTSTHPLYTASLQEPPRGAFYPNSNSLSSKPTPANPWEREEREKEIELRRAHARQWRDQQIRELGSLANRSSQQEEQLRALKLDREFERRAQEAAQDEDEAEKESPQAYMPQPVDSATITTTTPMNLVSTRMDYGSKSAAAAASEQQLLQLEAPPPPPPERGSSYAVMSMRAKETTTTPANTAAIGSKKVSFNDKDYPTAGGEALTLSLASVSASAAMTTTPVREDPNVFIAEAESMLASPLTPDSSPFYGGGGGSNDATMATPGVIGAQEVYRDPRQRRLAEQQAQLLRQQPAPLPEKLSFKEKMKMFAMETGEDGTPRDKSKISRAQREIDNIANTANIHNNNNNNTSSSGMVH